MSPTLELAFDLIRRPSVTPEDRGCQTCIAERLAALGFRIEWMSVGGVTNLWARRGSAGPLLCFAGHTDVVPAGPLDQWDTDPFDPVIRDGRLYGRGACDMKGSLAAMVVGVEAFVKSHPEHGGSLAFLITSDEEGPARHGTRAVMEQLGARGERIDYALVGEPSCRTRLGDTIKNGRRGSLNGDLSVLGKQGHVAYPDKALNPFHASAEALAALCAERWDAGSEHFPPTSFQIANLNMGTGADNVIPDRLRAQFNFRFSTALDAATLDRRVRAILDRGGFDYQLDWRLSGEPFLTPSGVLVDAMRAAIRAEAGIEPELSTSGGTSDGRFIAPSGAQVVEFGPVNDSIHQANEWVEVEALEQLARIHTDLSRRLLG
ncbi:MAG: succinyl-diaminopimelate desuccinylase [Chromatiaceae bacterium]|nr:succinyl-diaminopimelate desuccinylase [Chromatiaceae bacterium]